MKRKRRRDAWHEPERRRMSINGCHAPSARTEKDISSDKFVNVHLFVDLLWWRSRYMKSTEKKTVHWARCAYILPDASDEMAWRPYNLAGAVHCSVDRRYSDRDLVDDRWREYRYRPLPALPATAYPTCLPAAPTPLPPACCLLLLLLPLLPLPDERPHAPTLRALFVSHFIFLSFYSMVHFWYIALRRARRRNSMGRWRHRQRRMYSMRSAQRLLAKSSAVGRPDGTSSSIVDLFVVDLQIHLFVHPDAIVDIVPAVPAGVGARPWWYARSTMKIWAYIDLSIVNQYIDKNSSSLVHHILTIFSISCAGAYIFLSIGMDGSSINTFCALPFRNRSWLVGSIFFERTVLQPLPLFDLFYLFAIRHACWPCFYSFAGRIFAHART